MGCNCINEKDQTYTEPPEGKNIIKNEVKNNKKDGSGNKNSINDGKKVTIYKNFKKETQKGLTVLENVKELLPKNISKDNIKDMVYHALGNTIVEDKSKFIKGVNLTDEHAQVIVNVLYNIVHKNENVEEIDNISLKDINVTIGFYDATEENVRKFMFKKKQPTDEEVKNALSQLTAGDVDGKILAIEIKDEK